MNSEQNAESTKLPKLYRTVTLRFSSLRNGIGPGLGVIFDIDTMVERKAMRVLRMDRTWKWQICAKPWEWEYDYFIDTDQDILNEIGTDMDDTEILLQASVLGVNQ